MAGRHDPGWVEELLESVDDPLHSETIGCVRFIVIPFELAVSTLSSDAKALYSILWSFCWHDDEENAWRRYCYPTRRVLAWRLGRTVRHLQDVLKELEKAKVVVIRRAHLSDEVTKNLYILPVVDWEVWSATHCRFDVPLEWDGETTPTKYMSTHKLGPDKVRKRRKNTA